MNSVALRALVLAINQGAHGIDVTVTRTAPDDEPIATRGIWITPETDGYPVGSDFSRREPIKIIALSRLDVPTVPRGTVIVAQEMAGATVRRWKVDGLERQEPDHNRVIVVDVTED